MGGGGSNALLGLEAIINKREKISLHKYIW